jgi:hypothetical protein
MWTILFICWSLMTTTSKPSETPEEQHHEEGRGTHSEFVHILGSTFEDGFFGGVKWGIAAAFYHALYRVLAMGLQVIPTTVHIITGWYNYWSDLILERAPALNIHELQVLASLLADTLEEYATLDATVCDHSSCRMLCARTLDAIMRHIDQYVTIRIPRYEASIFDREILFLIQLIVKTIDSILNCIEQFDHHQEVIIATKTTIILIHKLISLLQGPQADGDLYDPSMAWFSGQKARYGPHI